MTDKVTKTDAEWRDQLDPMEYQVTRHAATERAFTGKYAAHAEVGTYACLCCGSELFRSEKKFDAGCGWPSFSKPIDESLITEKEDRTLSMQRTEVRSKTGDAHLGHVFNDGPKDKGGLRYCINSASLKFIPKAEMEKEGYGKYIVLIK